MGFQTRESFRFPNRKRKPQHNLRWGCTRRTTAYLEDGFPISLSAREIEVLALIAEGRSNQEISSRLYLALSTVNRHAPSIYSKLEVRKRTQAVSRARQLGLIG